MTVLDERQMELLNDYLHELEVWNRRMNLTTIAPEDYWRRHVEESLELLVVAEPPKGARVVDVGSGAGLPGIVIAVARSDLQVTLIESVQRKAAFLVHVAGRLALSNVSVVNQRAEHAAHDPSMHEQFEVAFSRAAAPPARLVSLALPLVASGGRLVAAVRNPAQAAAQCHDAARRAGGGEPVVQPACVVVTKLLQT